MKKAVFGEPVTAEAVETLPAETGPVAFVRLCAMLIGQALAERFGPSVVPQITERTSVPDGGVDAEYVSPAIQGATEAHGLIGPGRTVFQFKYRDITARGRAAALSSLRAQLRKDLAHGAPACDRFVLLTNLHLSGAQPHNVRAQLEGVPSLAGKPIIILGAAEIALLVNQSPHLRHLFFSTSGFCTVDFAEEELKASYATLGWPPFVGRGRELAAIREFVKDSAARVMQVIGARYIGKTRLVIEALKPYGARVVWSSRPEEVLLDHFRDLDTSGEKTILVVDGCQPSSAQAILEAAAATRQLKTIVLRTGLPSEAGSGKLPVLPFEHEDTGKLVAELFPKAPWLERSWLRETTAGVPGLILHVAALLREARISTALPSEEIHRRIGDLLEKKYLLSLTPEAWHALSAAALLPVLGVEGEPSKEAEAISRALGLDPEVFRSRLRELQDLGLIRWRGRFIEVVPPLLGDHLASGMLGNPQRVLAELRVTLEEGAFGRFLQRFRDLPKAEVREAIGQLLAPDGWFSDVPALVSWARHLKILAPAAPVQALQCLERLLGPLQAADLQTVVTDEARRSIVSTLEGLALRSATFVGAARLLLALAEAENESWSNNATGIFIKLFHWQHPEIAAPLFQRISLLREQAASPTARRLTLVARACGAAFGELVVDLHHAERGAVPEPPYRPGTWDEVREYAGAILNLLLTLASDADRDTREAASNALVASLKPFVMYSFTTQGLAELGCATLAAIERIGRSAPTASGRGRVVSELEVLVDNLSEKDRSSPALTDALERAHQILKNLTEGGLQDRIWRWVGPLSWKLRLLSVDDSQEIANAVRALASELVQDPAAFEKYLDWLTSRDAERRGELFLEIGKEDRGRRLVHYLLEYHDGPEWPQAFSAYVSGWSAVDRSGAEALLDDLADRRSDVAAGLVRATASLPPRSFHINRILRILKKNWISRENLIREAGALRWDELSPDDFESLIRGLDDGTPDIRQLLLWPFLIRLGRDVELTREARDLGWSFLEATAGVPGVRQGHDWDFLAAKLGKAEPERLLALVESLTILDRTAWQSLRLSGELPLVWRTLEKHDRPGLIRMLLKVDISADAPPWVGWQLEEMLRPAEDAQLLLDFAREHGADGARVVAGVLDASQPGFWESARNLLSGWGDDERVRERLLMQVGSGTYSGSAVGMVAGRLEGARRLLSDRDPTVARWAGEVVEFLEDWQRRAEREDREEWIWDYRIRRSELESMLKSSDSSQRLWAISRLLKDAPSQRVRDLLTPEEILEALPNLPDLDAITRRKWSAYARHLIEH